MLAGVWVVGLLALDMAYVAALFARYRRADETERRQIKWLLYACAVFLVAFACGILGDRGDSTTPAANVWTVFFGLSLAALPAAIGVAVLRYRLYDIDLLINRTLVYGSLTAALLALYFGGILAKNRFGTRSPYDPIFQPR